MRFILSGLKNVSKAGAGALLLIIVFFPELSGCSSEPPDRPEQFSFVIVNQYPHDPMAFTQGLAWDNGTVYEGTGKYGRSSLRRVDIHSGTVEQKQEYSKQIFAEGITVFEDTIYQLTWKNKIVFLYDKHDFSLIRSWPFPGQGWGITHDNRNLIVSDGTATLYFLDPATLLEKRRVTVHDGKKEIKALNELEYINDMVYANIWHSNRIAMIKPENGTVVGWLDLTGLRDQLHVGNEPGVLNGIMYDPAGDRLFVTGKLWPTLFEIRTVPVAQ